jgi:phage tail-like protein
MPERNTDPLIGFHFSLELSNKVTGLFTEVGGLGSESDVIEHKPTTQKGVDFVQKIPGRLKWGDITLKRGITATMDAWAWRQLVVDGKAATARVNGSIIMFDTSGAAIAQWDFTNGWPSKVSGPSLTSDSTAFGVEEITIVHEGIKRIK